MPPDTILAFDTSAAHCAAALLLADRVVLRHEAMDKGQAERLMAMLAEVLAEAGIAWADLTLIAVGTGPGNATGIRISVAAARGLALGLGIPATGVTRLEAAAFGLPRPLAVVENARRGEVFVQIMDASPHAPEIVAAGNLTACVGALPLAGSAAGAVPGVTADRVLDQPVALAEAIARIAAGRDRACSPRPSPFYLRGADASPPSGPPLVILP
ncbi:MAG: tRNA (adenosine(37)-N6)-threonylcarbamoyltransferase complex dimerization subunit type 1 TsaB [Pseudomonadota bacterium]